MKLLMVKGIEMVYMELHPCMQKRLLPRLNNK